MPLLWLNGEQGFSESAWSAWNPANASEEKLSEPPATNASALPARIRSHAYERLMVPAAHALTMFAVAPLSPKCLATLFAIAAAGIFRMSEAFAEPVLNSSV